MEYLFELYILVAGLLHSQIHCYVYVLYCFAGYDVYLVGGCVRDLIMKKIPKDFDVITTADLRQVIIQINEHAIVML
jgi:hypothetical protein